METHCTILAWKTPWMEEPGGLQGYSPQGCKELDTTKQLHFHFHLPLKNDRLSQPSLYEHMENSLSPNCPIKEFF